MSPQEILNNYFGLTDFRKGQKDIIDHILSRKDVMVIMPTGGGKSLCYQLPALFFEGVTLIVSPLISLMQDQVDALQKRKIPATFINSTLSTSEYKKRIYDLSEAQYKLIYVAPERLRSTSFLKALERVKVSFFAIDEAHCISQWGHDFRPDYMALGRAAEQLGRPPIGAFTATATPEVQDDIATQLGLRDFRKFVTGFARPNLQLSVRPVSSRTEKLNCISRLIETHKTGIIYCATRKRVEEIATRLHDWDIAHVAYHGGMSDEERKRAQEQFMACQADVAVATNAFGMGIDRADIRFVVHFEMPGTLEAYYQEAGRAGRDNQPAVCELLFNYQDKRVQEFFIEGSNPSRQIILDLYRVLRQLADQNHTVLLSIEKLSEHLGGRKTNGMAVSSALALLARTGIIERFDVPGQRIRGTRLLQPGLLAEDLPLDTDTLARKEHQARTKLESIIHFAYSFSCRQQWILRYFGESETEPCGACDVCLRSEDKKRGPTQEELLIIRKALSGVARMSRQGGPTGWIPRWGKTRIIQMLIGSRSSPILNAKLDQLSTYGILKNAGEPYLKDLFREMERVGLLTSLQKDKFIRLLTLTPEGAAVMQGQADFKMLWPRK